MSRFTNSTIKNWRLSIWSFWCHVCSATGDGQKEPVVVDSDLEPSASRTAVLLDLPDQ